MSASSMLDLETTAQLEEAKACQGNIPADLAFEEVVGNRTLSPCSLNDFMDYLYYVERNAESLQFFLWYCDYVRRWSNLLPRQKALAPMWDPEKTAEPMSRFIKYSHKREASEKMNKIISIMEIDHNKHGRDDESQHHGRSASSSSNASGSHASSSSSSMKVVDAKEDWQPFTIQPFRDEVSRIVRHYISESGPRQLRLNPRDRETCLQATQHTTHPSALLPAFLVAEASMKGEAYPRFIRWSISNGNRPRIVFLRLMSAFLILLGFALDVVLILSCQTHYLRILCITLWWPGFTVFVAACQGLCIILHFKNTRHVRPWEQDFPEEELQPYTRQPQKGDSNGPDSLDKEPGTSRKQQKQPQQHHVRKDTNTSTVSITSTTSTFSRTDPLRKASLQTFGPKNDPDQGRGERLTWMRLYAGKSLYQKIFEAEVPVQNQSLQLLRDRTVFLAIAWSGFGASVLTVASLFIPEGDMFL